MGFTKAQGFTARNSKLAKYAKALAHPARITILKFLAARESCQCGDIVDKLPLSQSTVSQHLKELRLAGLIKGDTEGTKICYYIDEKEWKAAQGWINQLFEACKGNADC